MRPLLSRRIRHLALAALAAAVALSLFAASAPAAAGSLPTGPVDRLMHRLVRMPGGPPGVAVLLQRQGFREFGSAGVAQIGTSAPWRSSDHMRLASASKAFSGAVALSLVQEGRLDLDGQIRGLLPWLPAHWEGVTVAQLLNHTSGLPDYSAEPAFGAYLAKHLHGYISPPSLIGFVAAEPLEFAPGSRYRYSNTDNIVVALIVQALAGEPYSQLLRQRVAEPLHLNRTTLPAGFRLPEPFVHGYSAAANGRREDVSTALAMSAAWASGGMTSSVNDVNRFVRGYLGGRLFGRSVQQAQLQFVDGRSEPPGPGLNAAGLGVFRYETRCGTVYGHTGNTIGYTQFIAASRNGKRSAIVSVNAQITPGADRPAVRRAFRVLRRLEEQAVCASFGRR
ncbi:MAG TPA: serine hydrolase domain-containing protein [Solirubrobacterales bacterium]|nr:serine hydrolase domain-containing protein [Solirubrobacterales bacterium]